MDGPITTLYIHFGLKDGASKRWAPRNPGGRGSIPRLGSRRSSLISIEHAE